MIIDALIVYIREVYYGFRGLPWQLPGYQGIIPCIWVWVGGILAVFLYRRFEHGGADLTGGQGAGLGALAGLIGALVGVVVYVLTAAISMPLFNNLASSLQIETDLPWQAGGLPGILASTLFFFVVDAILYPLFGALSGFIAASLMKKPPASAQ